MAIYTLVDDKNVLLYRIIWVAATPHYCGEEDCTREGFYEVRLEQGESVWATRKERDDLLTALETWYEGYEEDSEDSQDDSGL